MTRPGGRDDASLAQAVKAARPSLPLLPPEANPRHLMIKASAGSGKTFRLSTLYLILLAQGVPPESILATTFTRKAAGEIMERVLKRLAAAACDLDGARSLSRELSEDLGVAVTLPLDRVRELLGRLCGALHRVSIATLDSFFHRVARSFRFELGLPAEPILLDDRSPSAVDLRCEAIGRLIDDGPVAGTLEILASLQDESPGVAVEEIFDTIMAEMREIRLESGSEEWEQLAPVGRRLTESDLGQLARDFDALSTTAGGKLLAGAAARSAAAVRARDWKGGLESGPGDKIVNGEAKYGSKLISDPIFAPFHSFVAHAAAELTEALARQTLATRDVLDLFEERFARLQGRRQVLFFSDLPRLLGKALAGETELAGEIGYRLDGRVRHLLLDEFQDTSPSQWRVLRPLAAEIVSHGPPAASGRGFFAVGDIKQAIYGWRGGAAGIMNAARDELGLTSANEDRMDWSWRSSQVVLDAVHAIFQTFEGNRGLAQWPAIARRWQEAVEHPAAKRVLAGYVELATSPRVATPLVATPLVAAPLVAAPLVASPAPDLAEEEGEQESLSHLEYAARRIQEIARARPDATVGVLVARNRTAQDLLLRLQRLEVPASGESGNPLDKEPAVGVILAALALAEHPGDTIAAWRVFHSPLRNVLLRNVLLRNVLFRDALLRHGERHGLAAMTDAARLGFSRAIRETIASEGLDAVVGELAGVLAPSCAAGDGSIERLERLIAMAGAYPDRHPLLPGDFVRHVRGKSVEESSAARVRVMNVHKSKGLEFDIVVLPELHKKIGETNARLLVMREDSLGPITAVFRSGGSLHRALHPQVRAAHAAEAARRLEDDLAWLYVALTRARHALHMIIPPLKRKKDGAFRVEGYTDATHATIVRAALSRLGESEGIEGGQVLFETGERDWQQVAASGGAEAKLAVFGAEGIRPETFTAIPSRGIRRTAPSTLATRQQFRVGAALDRVSGGGMEVGTLVHAWFERVEWSEIFQESDEALIAVGRKVVPGMEEGELREWLARFRGWMRDSKVVAALARPECDSGETIDAPWRERAFAVRTGEELLHGQFDRVVVVRRDGTPVRAILTDFKTDRIADKDDIARKVEEYAPQMAAYRRALERLLGLPAKAIEARLLFPGWGAISISG